MDALYKKFDYPKHWRQNVKDKPVTKDPMEKLWILLKFLDLTLQDISDLRDEMLKENKMPDTLLIPSCSILGMKLQFYDGDTVKVAELQKEMGE